MKEKEANEDSKSKIEILKGMKRYESLKEKIKSSFLNFGKVKWVDTTKLDPDGQVFNFIDLFTGPGGLSLGFKQANYNPIYGIELDHDASETYKRNFPNAEHKEGDIRKIDVSEIKESLDDKEIHVLCAGFPCPGFSIAGERKSDDERNYLYEEIVRIAKNLQPHYIMLENVPGVLTIDDGKFFKRIQEDFREINYPLSVNILEAADYETPQVRSRAIFIGNRLGRKNPFPKPILDEEEYIPIENAINDLEDEPRNPEINHEWTNHSEETKERISEVEPGESLYDSYKDAYKRQRKGLPSMAVKENHGGTHIHHDLNRVISAREMARLQGFPDSFKFHGRMKRVMWQVGNAVPVPLARNIALAIRTELKEIHD